MEERQGAAHRIRNLRGHKKCIKRWILRIKYFGHSCIYDISAKSRYAYAMWQSVAMASLGLLLLSHCDILRVGEPYTHTHKHTQTSATFQLRTKRICSLVVSCSALLCCVSSSSSCSWLNVKVDWLEKIGIGIGNERERVCTQLMDNRQVELNIHACDCQVCMCINR